MEAYFVKGLIIGFSLSIPVGPIALLCIRRTLARGLLSGLFSGLGAATADIVYGAAAGFGVGFLANFLIRHDIVLRLVGGAFLCFLGIRTFQSVPPTSPENHDEIGLVRDYVSTLFLTFTNPMTMFAFAAVFAAAGVGERDGNYWLSTAVLVLGVGLGSAVWWLCLTGLVSFLHGRINPAGLRIINRISGAAIGLFGIGVLLSIVLIFLPK
ncbi:MAG TPA: LysE family transporter [Desulfomonilaceae bacterium]|nr:LysE family transporter [Desulfomonilaceae bacterium]